jgi:hypothetical protein
MSGIHSTICPASRARWDERMLAPKVREARPNRRRDARGCPDGRASRSSRDEEASDDRDSFRHPAASGRWTVGSSSA